MNQSLASMTTLGLGGVAKEIAEVTNNAQAVAAFTDARERKLASFILAGGSNVLASDAGFDGLLVHVKSKGISKSEYGGRAYLTVQAGESWDELCATAAEEGWSGIECLSGIPGSVGATPIQNVGAYGQEVKSSVTSVEVLDLTTLRTRTLAPSECAFGYRTSRFKKEPGLMVLSVTFALVQSDYSSPLRYAELAKAMELREGDCAPLTKVRAAVLALRKTKGMVLDAADPDTKSAGSFFTNAMVDSATVERVAKAAGKQPPTFAGEGGQVKLPAAWLVEAAGFSKGHEENGVGISSKHALALINKGGSAKALYDLSERILKTVNAKFGITLEREPVLLGRFTS